MASPTLRTLLRAWWLPGMLALSCAAPGDAPTDGGAVTPRDTGVPGRDVGGLDTPADRGGSDGSATDGPSTGDGGTTLCTVAPSAEPFRMPVTRLHWRATTGPFMGIEQVCSTPVVADIVRSAPDEPVVPEVAFMTFDCMYSHAVLRVISGRAPHRLLWSQSGVGAPNDERQPWILRWDGHPAVADLDGTLGNGLEVVVSTTANGLVAYHGDGSFYWRTAETMGTATGPNPAVNIADLDADGRPEVIAAATVYDGRTGAVRWVGTGARGVNGQGPLSVVADVDGDGRLEVVAGATMYDSTGRIRFGGPGAEGFSAVADLLDGMGRSGTDGVAEVAVVTRGELRILDGRTGMVRWSAPIVGETATSAMGSGGAPTVADFDGDGAMEVGVAGATTYTLFDPGCAAAGGGCRARGVRWATPNDDESSAVTSSTVFDFNGDGASEVVYNDEERFMVLDGRTGRVVFQDWNPSQTRTEQAIVADADGDGRADIVFGANMCANFAGDTIPAAERAAQRIPGLEIWSSGDGSWVGARQTWNEHGYHIDNINEDGQLPRPEPPTWRGHNTFRLNRARERILLAPDLVATPEAARCTVDRVEVCVTVTNRGDARVGMVSVGVYDRAPGPGVMPLATGTTTGTLDPTRSERVCVALPMGMRPARLTVRVDDGAGARECNEDNNVTMVSVDCGPA
ncbi:MAG: VCBS repeat-containing protein [Deltaproteobacteria bacterium]|nr:VCBS repeat-containing protein [Deltaproteobacteria bacterium]